MSRLRAHPIEQPCHFRDGLGDRWLRTVAAGDVVEVFRPCRELAAMRAAVRDRFARLTTLRLAQFVPVRDVDVAPDEDMGFEIVSDYVPGSRLSDILLAADAGRVVVSTDAALHVVRQVLGAVAALHHSRAVSHGAIAPERIIVTPKGHVVIAESVLGLALERLKYSRAKLWREYRIPMPPGQDVPPFNQQADLAHVGYVAVALLAGRLLESSECGRRISNLIDSLWLTDGDGSSVPIPKRLRSWLAGVLQVDSAPRFATARDAQVALEEALSKRPRPSSAQNPIKTLADDYQRARTALSTDHASTTSPVESPGDGRIPAGEWQLPAIDEGRKANRDEVRPNRRTVFAPAQ
jgi:serine/threonine protein kinase